ncbi:hypothetical protein BRC82_05815 [Halobacteriales archaeon QS_1_67_19]|nr:MAG: hypothetical protein BRC82_05815 [Halobacteriales archaeon QS_1_67_19]
MALAGAFTGSVAADGDPTAGDETFSEQLFTVLGATHEYRSVHTAKEAGYEELEAVAALGHVFEYSAYWDGNEYTGPTELSEPPALLFYAPISGEGDSDDRDLVLAGVEYTVSGDRTGNPPDLFADEDSSRELKVTDEEGWHRSPDPAAHDVTGLHVWLYLSNPEGLFRLGHPYMEQLVET